MIEGKSKRQDRYSDVLATNFKHRKQSREEKRSMEVVVVVVVAISVVMMMVSFSSSSSSSSLSSSMIAKPNCVDRCGKVSIPYPFGTTKECYQHYSFWVTCNQTSNPPKAFMQNSSVEITHISLEGQLRLLQFISHDCYATNRTRLSYNRPYISLPYFLTFSNTANKFTVIGCDSYGSVFGFLTSGRNYRTGCTATCSATADVTNGSCSGLGCCQTSFPKNVWKVELAMQSFSNYTNISHFNCGYGFVVEGAAFNFSLAHLTTLKDVVKLPMVADWAIGNGTCHQAQSNSSAYACKSTNSYCYKPDNGYGYRCSCTPGFRGNPYLTGGCQDIDECADTLLNDCVHKCVNKVGAFECVCHKGYHGDGKKNGKGCIRGESFVFKLVAGILLGIILLLLSGCWLHITLERKRATKMRQVYFHQNGGFLLQERLTGRQRSSDSARIFTESELKKATNNFDTTMIVGQGGYGIVYKGVLQENKLIAIKKSREVARNETEQFVNEVLILSQINHRNVVKLLGCCLEKQAPLLVYEFISNGTLFEHIHNKAKARLLSWDMRLRIATETAGVLYYLHSAASTPIIHRDVKSANILLDHTYTAKVSDFGASRLVPVDEEQLNTLVQGTFGYLDPEYMQTQQLTEKSDVYSFGVVLVELLTGRKALSNDMPEDERCLANFFLNVMKKGDSLFGFLEDNVLREGDKKVVMQVAVLAKSCLSVKGDERPSMKDVAMALEGLRAEGKHSWTATEHIAEDKESLLGKNFTSFTNVEGNSSSVEFDSVRAHAVLLPQGGGR